MEFLAALKTVYETRNSDDELDEPFLIYSRAADLIGNSYENKKKLSLFFAVSKRLNVLMLLSSLQSDGVNAIREQYSAVADLLSESAFNRLIDALIDIVGIVTPEMDEGCYEPYYNGFDDDIQTAAQSFTMGKQQKRRRRQKRTAMLRRKIQKQLRRIVRNFPIFTALQTA